MIPLALLAAPITIRSLAEEMIDPDARARFPEPAYESLQASSYNRESVARGKPGWFADSDGVGFLRTEQRKGDTEWVVMEHSGPGCITRIWTPFFYYDLNDHVGPQVRIYLDGSDRPIIDESLIRLVMGQGSVKAPFAFTTARAGDCYLPIPFAKSCRVVLTGKPFYYNVAYRAYSPGVRVETFDGHIPSLATLSSPRHSGMKSKTHVIEPGGKFLVPLPDGPHAVRSLVLRIPGSIVDPSLLRSTVLEARFDGERTIWCPLGDMFCSPDSIHPFRTTEREAAADGTFTLSWTMPYRRHAEVAVVNLSRKPASIEWAVSTKPWKWDDRSMHFHAAWRPDDVVPGTPFSDWNFVDIRGKGVYVGDAWTVLNIQRDTWWGEGDEKVYVDGAWERGFPTLFGTGSEDYYGWAGGVLPTRQDEFSSPLLANVRVGGLDGHTLGFNINTRSRALDAIPFRTRLAFDMESSFGVDIRKPWNLLGYSAVTFWYAKPGASDNRPQQPNEAAVPIMSVERLQKISDSLRASK